jgi:hypothetical protein
MYTTITILRSWLSSSSWRPSWLPCTVAVGVWRREPHTMSSQSLQKLLRTRGALLCLPRSDDQVLELAELIVSKRCCHRLRLTYHSPTTNSSSELHSGPQALCVQTHLRHTRKMRPLDVYGLALLSQAVSVSGTILLVGSTTVFIDFA